MRSSAARAAAWPARASSHEPGGVGAVAPELDRRPLGRLARGDRLQVTPSVAVPLAWGAVGVHDDVPELGPAAIEPPVEHDPPADPGAERESDHVAGPSACADAPFRQRDGVAVVLDAHRHAEPVAEVLREIEVREREIDGAERDPGPAIDVHRDADADRPTALREQLGDEALELGEELRLAARRRGNLDRAAYPAVSCDRSCEDLRPADVHPDDQVWRHDAATIPGLMPAQDKPYRLYRGGRVKGRVPLARHTSPAPTTPAGPGIDPDAHEEAPTARTLDRARPRAPPRAPRRVGGGELSLGLERRVGGERPRPGRCRSPAHRPGRAARLDAHDDPRSRHRRREPGRPRGSEPVGLDHAAAHGSREAPARVPLDPARPPGRDPRGRPRQDQRRQPARRACACAPGGQGPHGAGRQPRRVRRLRPLRGGDRRGRRDRGRRPAQDPVQQVRLPVQDGGALRDLGRAGASRAASSTWTAGGRSSTRAFGGTS